MSLELPIRWSAVYRHISRYTEREYDVVRARDIDVDLHCACKRYLNVDGPPTFDAAHRRSINIGPLRNIDAEHPFKIDAIRLRCINVSR